MKSRFDEYTAEELSRMRRENPVKYCALYNDKYRGTGVWLKPEQIKTKGAGAAANKGAAVAIIEGKKYDDYTAEELGRMRTENTAKYCELYNAKYGSAGLCMTPLQIRHNDPPEQTGAGAGAASKPIGIAGIWPRAKKWKDYTHAELGRMLSEDPAQYAELFREEYGVYPTRKHGAGDTPAK